MRVPMPSYNCSLSSPATPVRAHQMLDPDSVSRDLSVDPQLFVGECVLDRSLFGFAVWDVFIPHSNVFDGTETIISALHSAEAS